MKYPYSITTDLNSSYPLPTGEARYEFAQFRTSAVAMTTRELYFQWEASRDTVVRYADHTSLQFYCCTAAARRDFAASVLASRGMVYDAASDEFNRY